MLDRDNDINYKKSFVLMWIYRELCEDDTARECIFQNHTEEMRFLKNTYLKSVFRGLDIPALINWHNIYRGVSENIIRSKFEGLGTDSGKLNYACK